MKNIFLLFCFASLLGAAEWRSLFDGRTLAGWDDPGKKTPAGDSWAVEDGWITSLPKPRMREDLLTVEQFSDFELTWEWRLEKGSNSGLKYRVQRRVFLDLSKMPPGDDSIQGHLAFELSKHVSSRAKLAPSARAKDYVIGFEFQMIDDAAHPGEGKYATGALYDCMAPSAMPARPAGEINQSRLVVRGDHVEHWINGVKVIDAMLTSPAVRAGLEARWKKGHPTYELLTQRPSRRGSIALTHHSARAWFRNLRVRELAPER